MVAFDWSGSTNKRWRKIGHAKSQISKTHKRMTSTNVPMTLESREKKTDKQASTMRHKFLSLWTSKLVTLTKKSASMTRSSPNVAVRLVDSAAIL